MEMKVKSFCPCCGEEEEEYKEYCLDCELPVLPFVLPEDKGYPYIPRFCECDNTPYGEVLISQLEDTIDAGYNKKEELVVEFQALEERVRALTKLNDRCEVEKYTKKLLEYFGLDNFYYDHWTSLIVPSS